MAFKFEKLDVWRLSLDYVDSVYDLAGVLPEQEKYNLASQIRRAATSVSLNIAEGSTGQSDAEQARFLGLALRSLIETVGCLHLIKRRCYVENDRLRTIYKEADALARRIQAFRNSLDTDKPWAREPDVEYASHVSLWEAGEGQRTTDLGGEAGG